MTICMGSASRVRRIFLGSIALVTAAPALAQASPEVELITASHTLSADDASIAQGTGSPSTKAPSAEASAPDPVDIKFVASHISDLPISGDAPSTLRYGGRIDGFIRANASAIGGSSRLTLNLRPEFRWGEDSNGEIGLVPGNTALFRGEGRGKVDLSASLEYKWKSGATLEVGKMNLLDVSAAIPLIESNGHFGFQNLGIALPPSGVAPNTVTGAMLTVPKGKTLYRLWVFDVDSQYQRSGFEDPFRNGVAFLASATKITSIAGNPGYYTFALVGSTRDDFARDILPSALTPPPQPIGTFGNESGELAVQLSAYQYVARYAEAPGKGWGIIARFQASMGDPTFLDYSGYFGVSGNPRFRPQDRFGAAYFQYSLTDELVEDVAFRLGLEDEQGVELFYTYQFADNHGLTFDLQIDDSAIAARKTGVTVGLRLTSVF